MGGILEHLWATRRQIWSTFAHVVGAIWGAFRIMAGPLLGVTFATVVFIFPSQVRELYRALAEGAEPIQLLFSALAALLASLTVWWTGLCLANIKRSQCRVEQGLENFLLRWLPAFLAALYPVLLGFGLYFASGEARTNGLAPALVAKSDALLELQAAVHELNGIANRLAVAAWIVWLIAPLMLMLCAWLGKFHRFSDGSSRWLNKPYFQISIPLISLLLLSITFAADARIAQQIGTFAVLNVFVIWTTVTLSALFSFRAQHRVPIITLALLSCVVFSFFDLNDDHRVELRPLPAPRKVWSAAGPQLPFESWLTTRKDLHHFQNQGKPYPVFIVAAQGGGIYAAAQTAIFLARMQDRCPNFSEHVFAISAVSGGSIGAAAFSALARTEARNSDWQPCSYGKQPEGPFEKKARALTRTDLLSPLVASTLFPDFFERFIPWPIDAFDRSKAIEYALDQAWVTTQPDAPNFFVKPFLDYWSPGSASPALLLNTTEVETGNRRVISPFDLRPEGGNALLWFYEDGRIPYFSDPDVADGKRVPMVSSDITLGEAAIMSARFPWLLPAATVNRGGRDIHLVDGGYFDNSGIETARDLIQTISTLRLAHPQEATEQNPSGEHGDIKVYLITIMGIVGAPEGSANALSEIMSPIRTLLSTRDARGDLTRFREQSDEWPTPARTEADYRVVAPAMLDQEDFNLILGFEFGKTTENIIAAQIGYPNECGNMNQVDRSFMSKINARDNRIWGMNFGNSCQMCELVEILTKGDSSDYRCGTEVSAIRP